MKFRKKPVVIEAFQWTGKNIEEIGSFIGYMPCASEYFANSIRITTPEGVMTAFKNAWIIKGIEGEFYPCKPDIFDATYEQVTDE